MKRLLFFFTLSLICFQVLSQPDDPVYRIIPAPERNDEWSAWRDSLRLERDRIKKVINYDDRLYRDPSFSWASECFHIYFLMLFDQAFYDRQTGQFKVDKFILDIEKDFGNIDGVVLWHAYPRIGIDPRNQFDHYRDFPGGLEGLSGIIRQFHRNGIRVFIDYNPWDTGTRREGRDDVDILAEIIRIAGADGIFLDTLTQGGEKFRSRLDAVKPGVVLESELALPTDRIFDHHMSWAQWFEDSNVPGVLWNKWFERRHMMHQIKRWDPDHISELHTAWMNGSGMLIWENVFGTWRPWNERDKSFLRLMNPIQHKYKTLFQGEGWMPLYPVMMEDVYANLWYDDKQKLWTVVNRSAQWRKGILFKLADEDPVRVYDLFRGEVLKSRNQDSLEVRIELPPNGLGAILVTNHQFEDPDMLNFLEDQKRIYKKLNLLAETGSTHEVLIQPPVKEIKKEKIPEDMVLIRDHPHRLEVSYRQRECGFYEYEGYIPPPDRIHQVISFTKEVRIKSIAMDLTPVTNRQYFEFMKDSNYQPSDPMNFLKHWLNGKPQVDLLDHPVVYVSLADARAYANWVGKRLPREEEWQQAAQGITGLVYPWGNEYNPERCNHGQYGGTTPVKQFPQGRSPYGCHDMCGNVWELTESERTDGHTRYVLLKGGSWFEAENSDWYFQGGPQPAERSSKYILFWPGLDRSPTIGFRCVGDVVD